MKKMRKNYFILMALLSGSVAFGQSTQTVVKHRKQQMTNEVASNPIIRNKATLHTFSFANPGDWTTVQNGTATSDAWVIGTAVPSGSFPISAIASTTAGDGYALFDSDLYCSANGAQNSDVYFSTPVSLTGNPAVQVTFESYYRAFQGTCWVIASTDGVTWDEYQVHANIDVNDATTNPELTSVNVSATIGGSGTAYIGFRYKGGCDYAWMVDDVQIETVPPNELALGASWHGDIVNDWEYSMIPLTQTREMIAGVVISNNGATDESPAITCTVHDANGVVATPAPIATLIPIGVTDTIWFNTGFTPSANGVYHAEFSIPADTDPSNNSSTTSTLTVNDHLMAHDYGSTTRFGWSHTNTDPDIVTFANNDHSWGEIYVPTVTQDVYGMDVWIGTGTTLGNYLLARVFQIDPDDQGDWIQQPLSNALAQEEIIVEASHVNALTKVIFTNPVQLVAGKAYIFELYKADGTTSSSFYIAGSSGNGEDDDNSAVGSGKYAAAPNENLFTYFTGWDGGFYIRPNFNANLAGLVETSIDGISIYPNPTEGKLTITNKNNYNNTIEVVNLAGKVVYTGTSNKTESLDLSGNGAGVYFVNITNELGSITEKVILK